MQYNDNIDVSEEICYSLRLVRKRVRLFSPAGFTLVELMVVIAIIAVLLSIAAPQLAAYLEQGRKAKCLSNRYHIEQDEQTYYLNNNSASLAIDSRYQCASGGIYAWLVSDPSSPEYPRVGCSLHYGQVTSPLTSLGSNFAEISSSMIDLISKFYQKNNSYPRSWGDYKFTDLGLNPAEWAQSFNGLYYSPTGNRVSIKPAEGFTLTVQSVGGTTRTLTSKLNWDLVYNMADGQWYYHSISTVNAVNISTLQVIKN